MSNFCTNCGNKLENYASECSVCDVPAHPDSKTYENCLSWLGLVWALSIPVIYYIASTLIPLILISVIMPNFIMQVLLVSGTAFSLLNFISTFRCYFTKSIPLPFTKHTAPITLEFFEKYRLFKIYRSKIAPSKNATTGKFEYLKPTILNMSIPFMLIILISFLSNNSYESTRWKLPISSNQYDNDSAKVSCANRSLIYQEKSDICSRNRDYACKGLQSSECEKNAIQVFLQCQAKATAYINNTQCN